MHPLLAAQTSPVEWGAFVVTACGAFGAMVVSIVTAMRTSAVHREVRPPSNGLSLGALAEGIAQVQHMLVDAQHPDSGIPSATTIGRGLQAAAAADPHIDVPPLPERRADDPPPPL